MCNYAMATLDFTLELVVLNTMGSCGFGLPATPDTRRGTHFLRNTFPGLK